MMAFLLSGGGNPIWLRISETLRKLKLDKILAYLLGVKSHPQKKGTMLINPKVALKALGISHLLGYRKERQENGLLEVTRLKHDRTQPSPKEVLDNFNQMLAQTENSGITEFN